MDHRPQLRQAQLALAAVIETITDSQLDLPTPCEEWNVAQLLQHNVTVNLDDVAVWSGRDVNPDRDARRGYRQAADAAWGAMGDDAILTAPTHFAGADRPGWLRVSFHFVDAFVHLWDLGKALSTPVTLDSALVSEALRVAALIPEDEARGPGTAFGPQIAVPSGACDVDRLLSSLGRSPDWTP